MTAQIIDGRALAKQVRDETMRRIFDTRDAFAGTPGYNRMSRRPALAIVCCNGADDASAVYVNNKIKACREVGITPVLFYLDACTSIDAVRDLIDELNASSQIDGILIQLPLSHSLDPYRFEILGRVDPNKDVDGFTPTNQGQLCDWYPSHLMPCTAQGVICAIGSVEKNLAGKRAVVIGRSAIVGRPVAHMLMHLDCTVTIAHSKTVGIAEVTREADILVCAAGSPKMVTADMVKKGAIVIDVGINRDENGKLCGDVDFEAVKEKARAITPVPGGIGPLTVAYLMHNTVCAWENLQLLETKSVV